MFWFYDMVSETWFRIEVQTVLALLDWPLPTCLIKIKHFGKNILVLVLCCSSEIFEGIVIAENTCGNLMSVEVLCLMLVCGLVVC